MEDFKIYFFIIIYRFKSIFHRCVTQIIQPYTDRIQSLRISTPFAADIYSSLPKINHFSRLETLIITHIRMKSIEPIVDSLYSLPILSSLIILSIGFSGNSSKIYQKILCLPALKYCQL